MHSTAHESSSLIEAMFRKYEDTSSSLASLFGFCRPTINHLLLRSVPHEWQRGQPQSWCKYTDNTKTSPVLFLPLLSLIGLSAMNFVNHEFNASKMGPNIVFIISEKLNGRCDNGTFEWRCSHTVAYYLTLAFCRATISIIHACTFRPPTFERI